MFTLALVLLFSTEAILLQHPELFHFWYASLMILMLGKRYYDYRQKKWQFFMCDLCYFVQALCLVFVFGFPTHTLGFQIIFTLANGPLLCAMIMWKNRVVFHSFDKMVSVCIHLLPALLTFCWRWYGPYKKETTFDTWMALKGAFLTYAAWQLLYILLVDGVCAQRLHRDPDLATSRQYLLQSTMSKHVHSFMVSIKLWRADTPFSNTSKRTKLIFVVLQALYTIITFIPVALMYNNFHLHFGIMAFVFIYTLHQGSLYYQYKMK